jgi:predicted RNA methylase
MQILGILNSSLSECFSDERRIIRNASTIEEIIPLIVDKYQSEIENVWNSILYNKRLNLKKLRWIALVYKSSALDRFLFNKALYNKYIIDHEELQILQKIIFEWYETKASSGDLFSIFNMGISKDFDFNERKYFGFYRSNDGEKIEDPNLVDISNIFSRDFTNYYRKLLINEVLNLYKTTDYNELLKLVLTDLYKFNSTYKIVDKIVNLACQAILATSSGISEMIKIKNKLASLTNNYKIARAKESNICAALFCICFVDMNWKYYYYIPYCASDKSPYAAIALASIEKCIPPKNINEFYFENTFKLLESLETFFSRNVINTMKEWKNKERELLNYYKPFDDESRKIAFKEFVEFYKHAHDTEIHFKYLDENRKNDNCIFNNPKISSPFINTHTMHQGIILERPSINIEGMEIKPLLSKIDDMIDGTISDNQKFSADEINLMGWLNIDLISSTKIHARLSKDYFSRSKELTVIFRDYLEKSIWGHGAVKTNETPDGWMCGFQNIQDAVLASIDLLVNLNTFNDYIKNHFPRVYKGTIGGIGIRIGLIGGKVPIDPYKDLGDITNNILNLAGHFQKKGGDLFASILNADPNRPSSVDLESSVSWVFTISKELNEIMHKSMCGIEKVRKFLEYDDSREVIPSEISNEKVIIRAQLKKINSIFDKIDRIIQVDPVAYNSGERVYPYIKDESRKICLLIEDFSKVCYSDKNYIKNLRNVNMDIGAGSGIYSFVLAKTFPKSIIYSIEPNKSAVILLKKNLQKLFKNEILQKSLTNIIIKETTFEEQIEEANKEYDIIAFNLPYVPTPQDDLTFLHSNGGFYGLDHIENVIKWISKKQIKSKKILFPTYSLSIKKEKETSLIYYLLHKYDIQCRYEIKFHLDNFLPNWYILGYSKNPNEFFITIEEAFPEARRRRDAAQFIYQLENCQEGWKYMLHAIIELTFK